MLRIRLVPKWDRPEVLALPVWERPGGAASVEDGPAGALPPLGLVPAPLVDLAAMFLAEGPHTGAAGAVHALPRPGQAPRRLLLVGVGAGDEAGWRAAGAALTRAGQQEERLTLAVGGDVPGDAVRGLVEGACLASYRFRLTDAAGGARQLRRVTLLVSDPDRYADASRVAEATVEATILARDLTNMPSQEKTPAWFVGRITRAAARAGLAVRVWEPAELTAGGFGGILAVGGGSARSPRMLELAWRPGDAPGEGASRGGAGTTKRRSRVRGREAAGDGPHVVLVGKGITFDSGGIDLKPRDAMKLMRKDMAGAAAVMAATLGAAALELPVRVTAVAPLAENMVSGTAFRPGDVVRHFGGRTSEILTTDAEGRIVLADALAYAVERLRPDLLVDLATLTGANAVALGKRTAALYTESDQLAEQLTQAANGAGERVWRMPLAADYVEDLTGEVADLRNSVFGGAGSVVAALFLREFTGSARGRWAHLDMSAPSWVDSADGELAKGATGWGVRMLLRWLASLADGAGR